MVMMTQCFERGICSTTPFEIKISIALLPGVENVLTLHIIMPHTKLIPTVASNTDRAPTVSWGYRVSVLGRYCVTLSSLKWLNRFQYTRMQIYCTLYNNDEAQDFLVLKLL